MYKYTSLYMSMSQDSMSINRETYGLLAYAGDLGGLYEALFVICSRIVGPVSRFSLNAALLSSLFRWQPHFLERNGG